MRFAAENGPSVAWCRRSRNSSTTDSATARKTSARPPGK